MPSCYKCGAETPVTNFVLMRIYLDSHGTYYYFCSPDCLKGWLDSQEKIARHGPFGKKEMNWKLEEK